MHLILLHFEGFKLNFNYLVLRLEQHFNYMTNIYFRITMNQMLNYLCLMLGVNMLLL